MTQAESGEAFFSAADQIDQFRVEPRTGFGVLSAKQDFNSGMPQVGALFSALHRSLPSDSDLDHLPDQAFSGGLRFDHQWSDRTWKLAGFLAGSRVQGGGVQRSAEILGISRKNLWEKRKQHGLLD